MTINLIPSYLRFHEYTDVGWSADSNYNITRLDSTLLKLSAMGDVTLTSLADDDAIKWDAGGSKYVNLTPSILTTTTTTSTTTSSSSSTTSTTETSTTSTTETSTTSTTETSTTSTTETGTTTTIPAGSTTTTTTITTTTTAPVDNMVLLVHSNNNDGSTTFLDSSPYARTMTPVGNSEHSTDEEKFGKSSMYFDGVGDYIETADSAEFTLGTNDFTIDFWVKRARLATREFICGAIDSGGATAKCNLMVEIDALNYLKYYQGATDAVIFAPTLAITDLLWHHIAFVRDGNTVVGYLDGVAGTTTKDVTGYTFKDPTDPYMIGCSGSFVGFYFQGYVDEFRILNGEAYWTTNFTPPTAPYSPGFPVLSTTTTTV